MCKYASKADIYKKQIMKKGFTLIELLVVVAILGILAAVGIVSFGGFLGSAKESATKANHKQIVSFMQAEIIKCNLGVDFNLIDQSGNIYEVKCSSGEKPNVDLFVTHFFKTFTNPFGNEWVTQESGCPSSEKNNLGKTGIILEKNNDNLIKIETRFSLEYGCLTSTILVE